MLIHFFVIKITFLSHTIFFLDRFHILFLLCTNHNKLYLGYYKNYYYVSRLNNNDDDNNVNDIKCEKWMSPYSRVFTKKLKLLHRENYLYVFTKWKFIRHSMCTFNCMIYLIVMWFILFIFIGNLVFQLLSLHRVFEKLPLNAVCLKSFLWIGLEEKKFLSPLFSGQIDYDVIIMNKRGLTIV